MQVTLLRRTERLFPNPYMLVVVSKGMWTVKLCSSKILQFEFLTMLFQLLQVVLIMTVKW